MKQNNLSTFTEDEIVFRNSRIQSPHGRAVREYLEQFTKDETMKSPSPKEIKDARERLGLTQTQASVIIGATLRAWQYWEAGERKMDQAKWELFLIKTGLMKFG